MTNLYGPGTDVQKKLVALLEAGGVTESDMPLLFFTGWEVGSFTFTPVVFGPFHPDMFPVMSRNRL